MRKSHTVKLLLLGGGMLAFSTCLCSGCGQRPPATARVPYDPPWFDAEGKAIEKAWKNDENGNRVPVHTPHDANGKPIALDANGNPIPPAGYAYTSGSSTYHRTGGWWPLILWNSGGYGSSTRPAYRSGPTNTGSTYFGGSKPSGGSSPAPSGGTVSRGGFGGIGSSMGGSSAA